MVRETGYPSASYSITVRLDIANRPGMLGRVATLVGDEGGDIDAVDIVEVLDDVIVRDITINCRDEAHGDRLVAMLRAMEGVTVGHVSDLTFLSHLGGKIEIANRFPVKTRADLSRVYTPGVARVCLAIPQDPTTT